MSDQTYTVKKNSKNSIANIFVVFHFKEKQKSEILFLLLFKFPASFSKIGQTKWLSALMGYMQNIFPVCPGPTFLYWQHVLTGGPRETKLWSYWMCQLQRGWNWERWKHIKLFFYKYWLIVGCWPNVLATTVLAKTTSAGGWNMSAEVYTRLCSGGHSTVNVKPL